MTSRDLMVRADAIRREQGLSQSEWSRKAGMDNVGMTISRAYKRGNCKLSTLQQLLAPLGYELQIIKTEE